MLERSLLLGWLASLRVCDCDDTFFVCSQAQFAIDFHVALADASLAFPAAMERRDEA